MNSEVPGTGHVVIAGGTGFLGEALCSSLHPGRPDLVTLTRSPRPNPLHGKDVQWDGEHLGPWVMKLEGAAAVINLAGRSVDCRYTEENRREILDSRVNSVRALGKAISECRNPPACWIQAGSLAIYGDAGDRICDEAAPHGAGFSVEVCERWESAFAEQHSPSTRKVLLRIGLVLGRGGGLLARLSQLTRVGLGGTVRSGRQYISWLHQDDLNRIIRWAMDRPGCEGVYNATGPNPVTNRAFMRELRRQLGRPWSPPAPAWAVKVGAYLMGTEASLALSGRRCIPRRLLDEGFSFQHPDLNQTLRQVLH